MKATTEYGVQITRPGKDPIATSTYAVVSRTVARSDWAPVDPMEGPS